MLYNINPALWGESYWKMSHYLTMSYPENPSNDDKQYIKQYFELLQYILPCENCRNHYKSNLITYQLTDDILSSRYKLIKWLVDLHNEVNRRTGKEEMTVEKAIECYSGMEHYTNIINTNNPSSMIIVLVVIIIIIALIYYIKHQ